MLLWLGACCEPKPHARLFSTIDLSYDNGWSHTVSIKISGDGAAVIQKGRWKQDVFEGRLSQQALDKLENLYAAMPLERYDSVYADSNAEDLPSYKIVIPDKKPAGIFVYGDVHVPAPLKEMLRYVRGLTDSILLVPIDTVVEFESRKYFFPSVRQKGK